ncbi:hypothetical protein Cgig2_012041 [Carnegiea gigantea]|uniref:Uncharacterized protein n=1 Tax=Carnegiea gigantea TaxID=171969 RepID=A0A9Q1KSA7_9CARY|nr:hypothetical protein Cgig2_012041 [Carnegiea gigantea]
MQSSLYLYPDRAVGKGKRKYGNVYTSRKRSNKHSGVSASQLAGTDSDVGGAPPGKPDVWQLEDEGFPMEQLQVDYVDALEESVDGSIHIGMVAEEGVPEDATATIIRGDITVDDVQNSIDQGGNRGRKSAGDVVVDAGVVTTDDKFDEGVAKDGTEVPTQSEKVSVFVVNSYARVKCCVSHGGAGHNGLQPWGATYEATMVAGVDAVRCDTHGMQADNSTGPSSQTSAVVEETVAKGRDGSENPSPIAIVVTTSDDNSTPTSSEATHGRQSPRTTPPTCR